MAKAKKPSSKQHRLTRRQIQVVEGKVQSELSGIPQSLIAQQIYPNQTPGAASVSMSRELKNANVQNELTAALARHGITIDSVIGVVGKGMKARKVIGTVPVYGTVENENTGESEIRQTGLSKIRIEDHTIRLKAATLAAKMMGIGENYIPEVGIHFHNHIESKKAEYADT